MNSTKLASRSLLLAFLVLATSPGWSQSFDLRDPILPEIDTAPRANALSAQEPLVADATPLGDLRTPVGSLSIRPELLSGPSLLMSRGTGAGLGPQADPGVLTLAIEGRRYELRFVSRTIDAKFGMHHATLEVLGEPESHARFSLTFDGLILGTLQTSRATYRIEPTDRTTQRVYRIRSGTGGKALRFTQFAEDGKDPISRLERRHVFLEQLAAIRPSFASSSETGRTLTVRDGKLGMLAAGRVTSGTLQNALLPHADLTFAPESLQLRVRSVRESNSGRRVEFEQMIDGIPVRRRNVMLVASDGTIREIRTGFVAPERAPKDPIMSEREALDQATAALEEKFRARLAAVKLMRPAELHYHVQPFQESLVPKYRLTIDAGEHGSWVVSVNAQTGASDIFDQYFRADSFGYRICRDVTSDHPLTCSDPGAEIMWSSPLGGGARCPFASPMGGNNPCINPDPGRANAALVNADRALKDINLANPGYCCSLIGGADRNIDLVYKTSGAGQIGYLPTHETLVSPPGNNLFQTVDVVWHELGHHILHKYNPEVTDMASGSSEPFAKIFHEAFGDLMAAGIGLNVPPAFGGDVGDPWIMGDGSSGIDPSLQRDLKESLSFSRLNNFFLNDHEKSRVIGNFFYRVKTTSGISNRRILELILDVGDRLMDYDVNGLDVLDFKNAVFESMSPSETALLNAVESTYVAMSADVPGGGTPPLPPGQPAPPSAPPPPVPLQTNFLGCFALASGQGATAWLASWPPTPGATFYVVYLQSLSVPWISDAAITSNNFMEASIWGAGHQAWVFAAACNVNGCGNISNRALISMLPMCEH
jgi:hypothetical protein